MIRPVEPARRGEVRYAGQLVGRDERGRLQPDRRRVAMMFQDPVGSLSPRMTVGDLVTEPYRIHGSDGRNLREETARLLVLARGYHGAVDACLRNGWEDILALLD